MINTTATTTIKIIIISLPKAVVRNWESTEPPLNAISYPLNESLILSNVLYDAVSKSPVVRNTLYNASFELLL